MTKSLVYFVFSACLFADATVATDVTEMLQSSADRLSLFTLYNEKLILKTHADKILLFATILNQIDPVRVQEDHIGGGQARRLGGFPGFPGTPPHFTD